MIGKERVTSRPNVVILWGIGGYAPQYFTYLREAGIEVAVCVDRDLAGTDFNGVNVILPREYARQCYRYPRLPVVVTARGVRDEDRFTDTVLRLANEFDLPTRLLHPAFLADHLRLDYTGHVLLLGFPGAGGDTFQHVIAPLLERQRKPYGAKEQLLASLASEYHSHALRPTVDSLFNLGGRYSSVESTVRGDRIRIEMQLSHQRLAMAWGLRSKTYLYERLHVSHERLTDDTFRTFRGMHWTILVVVRHPLDIIVSIAEGLCRSPQPILANLDWFRTTALLVKEYYESALEHHDRITVLRYEDLLSRPADTIRSVARAMDVEVDQQNAAALWKLVEAKAVPSAVGSGHDGILRTAPGTWRGLCGVRHIQILSQLGYGPFLDALGYHETLQTGTANGVARGEDEHLLRGRDCRDAAYGDFAYHVLYDKPLHFRHETFCDERDPLSEFGVFTDDAQLWTLAKLGLSSRYVRALLSALEA